MLANADEGIAQSDLNDPRHTLSRLIGRPMAPLGQAVGAALKPG